MPEGALPVEGTPTAEGLALSLRLFLSAMARAALARAEQAGPLWVTAIVPTYIAALDQYLGPDELGPLFYEVDEQRDAAALVGLQVEMLYYTRRYAGELIDDLDDEARAPIDDMLAIVAAEPAADPRGADSVREGEVIKDSLKFLLDKLPAWLRRLVDVIFEALKISRGAY